MGVHAFVPVQEAFNIHDIANLQRFDSLVGFGVVAAEIELHAEVEGQVILGEADIQVVRLVLGVLVVEGSAVILGGNGQALEQDQLILVLERR